MAPPTLLFHQALFQMGKMKDDIYIFYYLTHQKEAVVTYLTNNN